MNKKKRRLYIYHFNPQSRVIETIERQTFKNPMTDHEYQKAIKKILAPLKDIVWSETEPRISL